MNIENLISQARARFDHEANKKILKEKYEARMLFAYNGGMFRAGPELLVMLETVPLDDAVILDLYETPIRVNPKELQQLAMQCWQEQMNAWLIEFEQGSKKR